MTETSWAEMVRIAIMTPMLGCGAAWLAGRAIALTWRSPLLVAGTALLLGVAIRFLHFALFGDPLLAGLPFLVETGIILAVGLLAFRLTRARQMVRQYYWLYEPSGPLGWRLRQDASQTKERP
jgi:hypothetical protein